MLLHELSATDLVALMRSREVSPVEAVEHFLTRIAETDGRLGAFLSVSATIAREEAKRAEASIAEGRDAPLLGLPISIKDLEPTAGIRTTYGSPLYVDHLPDSDSVAVARLRAAGAIVIGKTNTPEFGLLGETRNLLVQETRNPWDLRMTSGGSSGGSAAAVAAGLGPISLGSDGAGSVVAPASFCGVLGMKGTRGLVPFPSEASPSGLFVDVGLLARTPADLALLFDVMSGPHTCDPWSLPGGSSLVDDLAGPPQPGLRIAWTTDLGHYPVDDGVKDSVLSTARRLSARGAVVERAHPPVEELWGVYDPLFLSEVWGGLGEAVTTNPSAFLVEARDEVLPGEQVTGAQVVAALRRWWEFRRRCERFFDDYDALVMPTTAVRAFPLGHAPSVIAGEEVRPHWTTFMPFPVAANIAGLPEIHVPAGLGPDGLPTGVLVLTRRGREGLLLSLAHDLLIDVYGSAITPLAPPPRDDAASSFRGFWD